MLDQGSGKVGAAPAFMEAMAYVEEEEVEENVFNGGTQGS